MEKQKPEYKPEVCECCGQQKTYILALDKGTATVVKAISRHIGIKGINAVHPRKEMEGKTLSSNQVGNLTRARIHGLIARVRGERGNYLLTTKGSEFLHGKPMPKYAIVRKKSGDPSHNDGYYMADTETETVQSLLAKGEMWEGIGYEIKEGRIIQKI